MGWILIVTGAILIEENIGIIITILGIAMCLISYERAKRNGLVLDLSREIEEEINEKQNN